MASSRSISRSLALVLALTQLASPGLVAVADGLLQAESAGAPATHVEARTRAACLAVHPLDCAMCRYMSLSADAPPPAPSPDAVACSIQVGRTRESSLWSRTPATSRGRGPPAV